MKFAGWYGIVVGVAMLLQWSVFIATGQVPELQTEPWRIAFHLAAEGATALLLSIGGIALLKNLAWSRTIYLLGAGMLLYSAVVSPGYFAQQGQWVMVGMFAVILAFALVSIKNVVARPGRD